MLATNVLTDQSLAPDSFERLYLLEFMVHEVCYACATSMDRNFLKSLGPTCVAFLSDSFPALQMSEDEFGVGPPYDSFKVKFKSGKSCLFALRKGSECLVSDKAQITVSRSLPPGGCSPEYKFGTAFLKMSPEFLSVLSASNTSSKCLRVSLDILNCKMTKMGTIAIFLRLSCFGTTIITQFQADSSSDSKSFTFRGLNMTLDLGNRGAPPTQNPQLRLTDAKRLVPDISEKLKDELIIDLFKVIKSSAILNCILDNQSYPKPDRTHSAPRSQNQFDRMLKHDEQFAEGNYARPLAPTFPQFYQPAPSKSRIYPSDFKMSLHPNFQMENRSVPPNFQVENKSNLLVPLITGTQSLQHAEYPPSCNKNPTYEQRRTLSSTVSENVLCKPECLLKKVDTSKYKALESKALSRDTLRGIRRAEEAGSLQVVLSELVKLNKC